jgi:hypothetical protein
MGPMRRLPLVRVGEGEYDIGGDGHTALSADDMMGGSGGKPERRLNVMSSESGGRDARG